MRYTINGRYQLEQPLNPGGMSVIYLARDLLTNEQVVVKIMTAIQEDDKRNLKAQERFQREIALAREMKHPHILEILDAGFTYYEENEVPFLVSRYIKEGSLADCIEHTQPWKHWTFQQTADAVLQAAESLYYLHTRTPPIVHQDVKPGNFLFYSVNSPQRAVYLYLCDFGISRLQQSEHALASEVIGTAAYMAPEQLRSHVMPASDQYSLAIVACQLLTGKLPLQAQTNQQYAEAHLHEPPTPPSKLNAKRVPDPAVDEVILRALEKEHEKRYPNVRAFGQAFFQALHKGGTDRLSLTPVRTEQTGVKPRQSDGRDIQPVGKKQLEPLVHMVVDPLDTTGNQTLDEPLPARPLKPAPVSTREKVVPVPLPLHTPVRIALPSRPKMLYWSRDGNSLASIQYGQAPIYIRPNSSLQTARVTNAAQVTGACWSPDGRVLAINTQDAVRFWDAGRKVELPLVLSSSQTIEGMDWSVENRLALWIDNQILMYSLPYTQLQAPVPPPPIRFTTGTLRSGHAEVLRWSPDGQSLVAGASNGDLVCWQPARSGQPWRIAALKQKINSLAWSPDGTLLVAGLRNNQVVGWDMHSRQQILHWEHLPVMPRQVSVAKNGHIVLASSNTFLLFGFPGEAAPSGTAVGQLLASWSPTRRELATLDEQREDVVVIWHE